jgi:hypothetical protein
MSLITGVQQRDPKENMTSPSTNYNYPLSCNSFSVYNTVPTGILIRFESTRNSSVCVGLEVPSKELAIALGRALLSVGEGCLNESTGTF